MHLKLFEVDRTCGPTHCGGLALVGGDKVEDLMVASTNRETKDGDTCLGSDPIGIC